ncbi:kinase-like domain-containing protein [Dactylonectria macrodidyma]|uniref:Kinase-like domain-containing protein n=1 Tax=Dactylonectria macrodidyma TaxID=307937 RepID=A0A9P9JKM6_9HYPO|nr:kinase-like domain-containing protein [Dactylonectria macrodidyma]
MVSCLKDQVHDISSQILGALFFMHSEHFAHRDLKPANTLIDKQPPGEWSIKLCDLGLSKPIDQTVSVAIRGTLGFLPPELTRFAAKNRPTDPCKLSAYCNAKSQTLRDFQASEPVIDFVLALMQIEPSKRLSSQDASTHRWVQKEAEVRQELEDDSKLCSDMPFWLRSEPIPEPTAQWTGTAIQHPLVPLDPKISTIHRPSTEALPVVDDPFVSSQHQEPDPFASWTSIIQGLELEINTQNANTASSTSASTSDGTVSPLVAPSHPKRAEPAMSTSVPSTSERPNQLSLSPHILALASNQSPKAKIFGDFNFSIHQVKFSPDGSLLIAAGKEKPSSLGLIDMEISNHNKSFQDLF